MFESASRIPAPAECSSALVIGVGALGCHAATSLVAAGIGRLTLIDDDRVELSNLQRQVLFDEQDIGRPKAVAAALALRAQAGATAIVARTERVSALNVASFVADHDVVVDATDDPETKYLVNQTAAKSGKRFVYGGVARTGGLAMAVSPGSSACLACVFPPELAHQADGCTQLGILAPVAGTIGALQAHLALRLLTDAPSVAGLLYVYELRGCRWRTLRFRRDQNCSICSTAAEHAA